MDANEVERLLRESHRNHINAGTARRLGRGTVGSTLEAQHLLKEAATLRVQAAKLDPDRTAPAWAEEQGLTASGRDTHEELMAFYRAQGVL